MSVIEKISRTVFVPCRGLAIRHHVIFGEKDRDQTRKGELRVREYNSTKYSNVSRLATAYLETQDYLVLDPIGQDGDEILLSYQHVFRLKEAFAKARRWFYHKAFSDLFVVAERDGGSQLMLNSDWTKSEKRRRLIRIVAGPLVGKKEIMLEPCVVEDGEGVQYEGLTMYLNRTSCSVQMTVDQVEAVYDFLKGFNLYSESLLLINYVASVNSENLVPSPGGISVSGRGRRASGSLRKPKKRKAVKGKDG